MSESKRTFELGKLVRDGIVSSTQEQGGEVIFDVLSGEQKTQALIDKLREEINELCADNIHELSKVELTDLLEIVNCLAESINISREQLSHDAQKKAERIGSFALGHFIHTLTLPEDNRWAKYYASHPDRFPEVK